MGGVGGKQADGRENRVVVRSPRALGLVSLPADGVKKGDGGEGGHAKGGADARFEGGAASERLEECKQGRGESREEEKKLRSGKREKEREVG